MRTPLILSLVAMLATALGALAAPAPTKVQAAVAAQQQLDKTAAASQKKIDKVAGGTQDMLNEYLNLTQQTDDLRAYDAQLQQLTQAQKEQIDSLNTQIQQVDAVKNGVLPLMVQMADSLVQFVKLDIPYRRDERLARAQALRALLNNPTATANEQFQKLVQAYNDEIAAGRTVETYRGEIDEGGKTLTVNFLRVGHLALAYQTSDKSETGYWDKQKQAWQVDNDYRDAVSEDIAIVNKQAAPDLLEMPVEAPEVGK